MTMFIPLFFIKKIIFFKSVIQYVIQEQSGLYMYIDKNIIKGLNTWVYNI